MPERRPGASERALEALRDGDLDAAIEALENAEPVAPADMPDSVMPTVKMTDAQILATAAMLGIPVDEFRASHDAVWAESVRRGIAERPPDMVIRGCFRNHAHIEHLPHYWTPAGVSPGTLVNCPGWKR